MTNPIETTSNEIQTSILDIDDTASADHVAATITRLEAYIERGKELKVEMESALMRWITVNGEVQIGTVRYYVGTKKTTRCIDTAGAIERLLMLTSGDFEAVCACLASQPLKPGACREVMGDDWAKFFNVFEESDLKEGKPIKRVQKIDERFIGKGAATITKT